MHRTITLSCTLALAPAFSATAQTFSLQRSVIATGGGTSSGGAFTVTGTAGETAAGSPLCYGGTFDLASGFWARRPAVMWPEIVPLGLQFLPPSLYSSAVRWSPSRAGWTLEYSHDLTQWNFAHAALEGSGGFLSRGVQPPLPLRYYWRFIRRPLP